MKNIVCPTMFRSAGASRLQGGGQAITEESQRTRFTPDLCRTGWPLAQKNSTLGFHVGRAEGRVLEGSRKS